MVSVGGIFGKLVGILLIVGFGELGVNLFVLVLLLVLIILVIGLLWFMVMEKIGWVVLVLLLLFNCKKE